MTHQRYWILSENMIEAWIVIALGGAMAGFVQGLAGFGFGLVSLAVWSWVLEPEIAVPAVVFGSLIGQMLAAGSLRHAFDMRRVVPFLVGGGLGVPVGIWLLSLVSPLLFKFGVGVLLCLYCMAMLFISRLPPITRGGCFADGVIGWAGGIASGFGGLPGPIPTIWCTLRGWTKHQQRMVFQTFNLFMHALTFTAFIVHGMINDATIKVFFIVGPAVLIPSLIGVRLYRTFSDLFFKNLVLGLLAVSGVMLVLLTAPQVWELYLS